MGTTNPMDSGGALGLARGTVAVIAYDPRWAGEFAAEAALRDEYARLKQELAARYPNDRDACTRGKEPFIRRVLAGG